MEDVFRLRFKVYCDEKGFLPGADYPLGLEIDEFDPRAIHIIVNGDDGIVIGYMRILDGQDTAGYPLFAHGLTAYDDFPLPPEGGAIEISRMIVRSDYRHEFRPADDGMSPDEALPDPAARNASDLVQYKLLRIAYRHAFDNGIRWIYAAMEPTLHRKFRMMGMPFRAIGPTGDYLGEVRPYAMNIREMQAVLKEIHPDAWVFFDSPADDPHVRLVRPGEWRPPLSTAECL